MGPTAVGKTALAIAVARHFSTKIISADSRQCYNQLTIGVAKPSNEELAQVHHYFINSHSIQETVNAAVFEKYALQKIDEIFLDRDIAVMVGGTGLYIKTFCNGIDKVPVILPGIREQIISNYTANGPGWLRREVEKKDPVYFNSGEIDNPHRLIRALEVILSTGKSITHFQTGIKAGRDFEIIKIGLQLPKEELYPRINGRVDVMIRDGLIGEVSELKTFQHLNALHTVGYKELFDHFDGKISLGEAIELIKINTRHYAKRQLTWFNKDKEVKWCKPDFNSVMEQVDLII